MAGGLISLLIIVITSLFALTTLRTLLLRDNPTVMSFVRENALTAEDEYKIVGRAESMIAFAIGDRNSGKPFNDPRILKWYAEFLSFNGGEYL